MFETVLSFARDHLLPFARDHLLPYLVEVANMIRGVSKDITDMKDELEKIEAMIHDADKAAAAGEGITRDEMKAKAKLLIEAAFHMEDVIDEYLICEEQEPRDPRCAGLPCDPADFIKTMILRVQTAHKIQGVKSRVRAINESSQPKSDFHIQPFLEQGPSSSRGNQNTTLEKIREAPLYMDETQIVGFEAPRDELIRWLIKGRTERTVISVVGMGGLGKTTLAKKVFDNREVIRHFDCHAWITVSQSYTEEGLLRDMLRKFSKDKMENISKMEPKSLIEAVRNYLQQKRYVVFFDDVWDEHFWNQIEWAVHDYKNGSRILITTRFASVAMSCKNSSFVKIHDLQPLTKEKSLELFCKKAFFEFDGRCPEKLERVSNKIVEKCNGLPLALVVIGGLLSSKNKTTLEWEEFTENLSLELQKNQDLSSITKILGFSYNDLPNHLRPCFLYFGMYPEDYEIKSKRLILQWIAEGFVKEEMGKTSEKVAEGYLKELIHRSLVQVSSVTSDDKASRCRVHDLTRELILGKCEDLRFCHSVRDESAFSGVTRRLSIATGFNDLISNSENCHIRSIFTFTNEELTEDLVSRIVTKYTLSKVLDFEYIRGLNIPDNLGNLIHLKYLSFKARRSWTRSQSLPKSIGKLQNLETLNAKDIDVNGMPEEIYKLKKLRHLVTNKETPILVKGGIGGMTSLQTLKYVTVSRDEDGAEVIRELGKLKQLRKLGLIDIPSNLSHLSVIRSLLNEMQQLETLYIRGWGFGAYKLNLISSSLKRVRKLYLRLRLDMLPEWVPELQNLVKLTLQTTLLIEDPMKSLQKLRNLSYLVMGQEAYAGESLHFEEGGFQNLRELYIHVLIHLEFIIIEEGAMSSLKKLSLSGLRKLKKVPNGICYLNKLQHLVMWSLPTKCMDRFAAEGGEDHEIIKHVPIVDIGK